MRKLFLIDFVVQTLVLLPLLLCDILGRMGFDGPMPGYIMLSFFLTAPVAVVQIASSLLWTIKGSLFHKIYLPLTLFFGGVVIYSTVGGGEGISNSIFWLTLYGTQLFALAYWVFTFFSFRSHSKTL